MQSSHSSRTIFSRSFFSENFCFRFMGNRNKRWQILTSEKHPFTTHKVIQTFRRCSYQNRSFSEQKKCLSHAFSDPHSPVFVCSTGAPPRETVSSMRLWLTLGATLGIAPLVPRDDHGNDLQQLSVDLGMSMPNSLSGEEETAFIQECFSAAFQICKNGEWEKISKIIPQLKRLKDRLGRSLFIAAVEEGDFACVQGLLKRGFSFTERDAKGNNALHIAARNGHAKLMGFLTDRISPNDKNLKHRTPLHVAIKHGHAHVVQALLDNQADRHIVIEKNGIKLSPAAFAAQGGRVECLALLDIKKACTEQVDQIGNLLHLVVLSGQLEVARYLLKEHWEVAKPLLSGVDINGRIPLHIASMRGDIPMVNLLVEKDPKLLEAKDKEGRTSVHLAALAEQPDVIQVLDYLGADLNANDNHYNRPLDLVKGKANDEAIQCASLLVKLVGMDKAAKVLPPDFAFKPPHFLVWKGGGPAGIGHIGALLKMQQLGKDKEVKGHAGSSAGAILAGLAAAGLPPETIKEQLKKKNLVSFLDASSPFHKAILDAGKKGSFGFNELKLILSDFWNKGKLLSNPANQAKEFFNKLATSTGMCDGEDFRLWMEEQIAAGTGIANCTFGELHKLAQQEGSKFKELKVYIVKLGQNGASEVVCISSDDKKCKDYIISDIIRCSMSIPGVFKPHMLYFKDRDGMRHALPGKGVYVDGGFMENFPLHAFDQSKYQQSETWGGAPNRRTLGISLTTPPELRETNEISGPIDLLKCLMYTYWCAQEIRDKQHSYNKDRVIEIPRGEVGLLDFELTEEEQDALIKAGEDATEFFFQVKGQHKKDATS
ncbi:MAG: hypothetical protein CK425_04850 [Parachlamydia sp.]|nr:MAG: hypothetical protein CK425_04850 [Parachlamydia sp.]